MRQALLIVLFAATVVGLLGQSLADISRREQKNRQKTASNRTGKVAATPATPATPTTTAAPAGRAGQKPATRKRSFTNEDLAKASGSLSFSKVPEALKNRPHAPAPRRRSDSSAAPASSEQPLTAQSPTPGVDLGSRSPLTRPYG